MDSSTESMDFPLTAANGITRREIETCTHTDKKSANLE
jgi:hypothetical protein